MSSVGIFRQRCLAAFAAFAHFERHGGSLAFALMNNRGTQNPQARLLRAHFLARDAPMAVEPCHDFARAGMVESRIAFLQPQRPFDPQILKQHQVAAHETAGFTAASHGGWAVVCGCGLVVLVLGVASTSGWARATAQRTRELLIAGPEEGRVHDRDSAVVR